MIKFSDLIQRGNYKSELDLTRYEVGALRIVDRYQERDWVICSLPGRHQHKKGFVVETPDGFVSNVGKDCGLTELGQHWERMQTEFRDRERDANSYALAEQFIAALPVLLERVTDLERLDFGWKWLRTCQRCLAALPPAASSGLRDMFRGGGPNIWEDYSDRVDDAELAKLGFGKGAAPTRIVGTVRGLDGADQRLAIRVESELIHPLKSYQGLQNASALSFSKRKACAQFYLELEEKFRLMERLLAEGRRIFTTENFEEIMKFSPGDGARVLEVWRQIAKIPPSPVERQKAR